MLNTVKPVHINLSLDSTAGAGDTSGIYTYETVPDTTVALKVTVPGMGAGPTARQVGRAGRRD